MTKKNIQRYHLCKSRQKWCQCPWWNNPGRQKTLDIASLLAIGKDEVARGPSSWSSSLHGTVSEHLRSNLHDNPSNVVIFNDQSQWLPLERIKIWLWAAKQFMDGVCFKPRPWFSYTHPFTTLAGSLCFKIWFLKVWVAQGATEKNNPASSWGKDCQ